MDGEIAYSRHPASRGAAPHARWLDPPRLGHIPMWDDPELVAQILLEGSSV
jgi:pimeloyl-ACP methyl ester carboxylesterase